MNLFSETEVSMAEASRDPEPGPSTSVTVTNIDVPSLFYTGLEVLHHLN